MAEHRDIAVADLKLDVQNPRHQPASGQREAIEALLDEGGEKLVKLAEDIAENGLSPIDEFLVIRASSGPSYTVVEGNRRIAAVKLLINPDLARGQARFQKRFQKLAKSTSKVPLEVHCAVVATRDEAKHWMELRHTGERGGAGVVPWNAEATHRFAGRRGSHADRGIMFIEALQRAYPRNAQLQKDLEIVRRDRLTTLGRLVSDPSFRDRFGFQFADGGVLAHYSAKGLEASLERVISDLAETLTVSALKTKEQRRKYVDSLARDLAPDVEYSADPVLLAPASKGVGKKLAQPQRQPVSVAGSRPLFDGVELTNLGDRVASLLREIKRLDPDRFPNAAAVLVRVLLELAVGQVFELKQWKRKGALRKEVQYCLTKIDPSGKARKYQAVRTGLQDGTSALAVSTIQAFLHNPDFHPTAAEVRRISANYAAFLSELDALV